MYPKGDVEGEKCIPLKPLKNDVKDKVYFKLWISDS